MTIDKGILIRNIYYMLSYAFKELRQNNYEDIDGEEFDNIYDLFSEILYKGTASLLKRGLHKTYIPLSDTLTTVRGKINIPSTISLHMQRRLLVSCEFDEFSEDNLYNRIIKSTLILLSRRREIAMERRHRIRRLLPLFSGIAECDLASVRWNDIKYDRNSSNYRFVHNICQLIVKGLLLTTETGRYRVHHFDDGVMSRLFEKFVLNYYIRHYPRLNVGSSRVEWNIDEEASTLELLPAMITDITIRFPKRTLIIDTKYYGKSMQTNMAKRTVHNANLYQINSYVMHEDKSHSGNVDGMLLYAKTQETITPDGQMSIRDGNTLYFRTLDLNRSFTEIKTQLDSYISPYL